MATMERPAASAARKNPIIELSDSDEEPSPAITLRDAPTVAGTKAASASDLGSARQTNGREVKEEEDEDEDEDEGEDFGDSDSFIEDLIVSEEDKGQEDRYSGEQCTAEEAIALRRQLHAVGIMQFVKETLEARRISAKKLLTAFGVRPPGCFEGSSDTRYYRMLGMVLVKELATRQKLEQYNTVDDVVELIEGARNIMVITGAGISTNLGIPDFRSEGSGFYSQMREKGFDDPQSIFDLHEFELDPRTFYENCGDTFPKEGVTSPTHAFIALLQEKGKLLRNYTQNIDNIEAFAGIREEKLIQCHGSWAKATCMKCGYQVDGRKIMDHVKAGVVPECAECVRTIEQQKHARKRKRIHKSDWRPRKGKKRSSDEESSEDEASKPGVMKPNITFFHEQLPSTFFDAFNKTDKHAVDLVIVIGTSMSVTPVSEIPQALSPQVPHVYISNKLCGPHIGFDVTLLGDCDTIVGELAKRLGWELKHEMLPEERKVTVVESQQDKAVWEFRKVEST